MAEEKNGNIKVIAENRKAYHEFFIDEKIECGIELVGTEVKSLRGGNVNFRDSYAMIKTGECWLCGMHISPYEHGNIFNKEPMRDRRLLLHRNEIDRLFGIVKQKGLSLVPLELYFKKGRVKLLLGVARGKKLYDKRESMAQKDTEREIDRRLKSEFGGD